MYNYCFRNNMMNLGIVSFAKGDVNGDGIPDNVYLTGKRSTDSAFTENITLIIQDGRTGRFFTVLLKENSGYDPSLFIGDFTGDGSSDILISIAAGGSGGIMYHYIYSFVNNTAKLIFDFNAYNEKYKYDVTYKDFY
ncbi:MAG: spore coat protein, partial [Clostridiaceae bacterium]|nr:spore coat protein [Clostridiaceae bacterium]